MMHLSFQDIDVIASRVARQITLQCTRGSVYGIPKGGVFAAYAVLKHLPSTFTMANEIEEASVIIDDIVDSGTTRTKAMTLAPNALFCSLLSKDDVTRYGELISSDEWVVFPWEGSHIGSAEDIVIRMLQYIGEDPQREGLLETPKRIVKAWGEWFGGYKMKEENIFKVFEDGAEGTDSMVIVKDIPFTSHCEHHGAQFHGVAHIGYIPDGKIVGLSKLARITHMYAKRFQVQERLGNQIADSIERNLNPLGVAVVLQAEHTCMSTRGVKVHGSTTITSAMRGAFRDEQETRNEFLSLIKGV